MRVAKYSSIMHRPRPPVGNINNLAKTITSYLHISSKIFFSPLVEWIPIMLWFNYINMGTIYKSNTIKNSGLCLKAFCIYYCLFACRKAYKLRKMLYKNLYKQIKWFIYCAGIPSKKLARYSKWSTMTKYI